MRKLLVHEFMSMDGVMQAPGGPAEDREGGFEHGGWTRPYWHDDIGANFFAMMQDTDAFLLDRRTYVTHAEAFEPMGADAPFYGTKKYVVSRTLEKPIWRDTTIIRDDVVDSVRALKAQPGGKILTDGSSQLVPVLLEHDLGGDTLNLRRSVLLGAGTDATGFPRMTSQGHLNPGPDAATGVTVVDSLLVEV